MGLYIFMWHPRNWRKFAFIYFYLVSWVDFLLVPSRPIFPIKNNQLYLVLQSLNPPYYRTPNQRRRISFVHNEKRVHQKQKIRPRLVHSLNHMFSVFKQHYNQSLDECKDKNKKKKASASKKKTDASIEVKS